MYLNKPIVRDSIYVNKNMSWTWQNGNCNKQTSTQHELTPFYYNSVKKYGVLIARYSIHLTDAKAVIRYCFDNGISMNKLKIEALNENV